MSLHKPKSAKRVDSKSESVEGFSLLKLKGAWRKGLTVAHLEYMKMRTEKKETRFILCAVGCNAIYRIPSDFNIDNIQEFLKKLTALSIEGGEIEAKSELEAELVKKHLRWCRSPDYDKYQSYPATDGIVNRYKLTMKEYPHLKWDNKNYTKNLRLEVRFEGHSLLKEILHLPWTTTLRDVAQWCAERAHLSLKNLSFRFKVDGRQMDPKLEQPIGDLGMFSDRIHLEVDLIYIVKGKKPPAYQI